ncbi:Undecaprenyl-phosphate alpha-N-acetylglucosaminyl 1-phosphate transferase [Commensalibacter sp. Nvir]|uniref:glycosyltransferase family 4 protein n=1 Tax=Commensalibacter sp. Nvir TaxID=3069817 RepID=UPI002D2592F3|nr:Undecaprenyl-phosphate alpha-N-acetylglucosaminyl 1-phosphate transferase [Commensalibacter sp. Nvir]
MVNLFPHLIFFFWLVTTTALSAFLVKTVSLIGVMDHPVERSSHHVPIPKGGGIGIITAFTIGTLVIFPLLNYSYPLSILALLIATVIMSVVSWFDDVKQWPAFIKLLTQFIASFILFLCIPSRVLLQHSNTLLIIFLFLWPIYLMNALNFMDGLNGLASGVAALTCIFFSFSSTQIDFNFIALALFCGLMGFMPYNFPKAKIFMSDVGSQSCGLILASLALSPLNQMTTFSVSNVPPSTLLVFCLLFGILYDATFTLCRRFINKDSLLKAHRSHLYQIARRSSLPASLITLLHWFFCIWGGILALNIPHQSILDLAILFLGLLTPQILWTFYVVNRMKNSNIKKW